MWLTQTCERTPWSSVSIEEENTSYRCKHKSLLQMQMQMQTHADLLSLGGGGFSELGLLPLYNLATICEPGTWHLENFLYQPIHHLSCPPNSNPTVGVFVTSLSCHPQTCTLIVNLPLNKSAKQWLCLWSSANPPAQLCNMFLHLQVLPAGCNSLQVCGWSILCGSVECHTCKPWAQRSSTALAHGTCVWGCLISCNVALQLDHQGNGEACGCVCYRGVVLRTQRLAKMLMMCSCCLQKSCVKGCH